MNEFFATLLIWINLEANPGFGFNCFCFLFSFLWLNFQVYEKEKKKQFSKAYLRARK
jgi:hypothetical protein